MNSASTMRVSEGTSIAFRIACGHHSLFVKTWSDSRSIPDSGQGRYFICNGRPFKDVKLGLKNAVRRAGLKGITWHTFRHTFASCLVQHGADIATVKELLGHSTIVVTMRYAHSNDESKRRAVAKLGSSDKVVTLVKNRAS